VGEDFALAWGEVRQCHGAGPNGSATSSSLPPRRIGALVSSPLDLRK
jgi:hypothetical protein